MRALPKGQPAKLTFSGYEWQIRQVPSDRGGANDYDPANAWTDESGALHLRIAGTPGRWTSAEVILTRSLGYGTYSFVVRDVSHLEPAVAFGMFTWDDLGVEQNHREVGRRNQPLGRSREQERAVRHPALLRRRQRRAFLGAGRPA